MQAAAAAAAYSFQWGASLTPINMFNNNNISSIMILIILLIIITNIISISTITKIKALIVSSLS